MKRKKTILIEKSFTLEGRPYMSIRLFQVIDTVKKTGRKTEINS